MPCRFDVVTTLCVKLYLGVFVFYSNLSGHSQFLQVSCWGNLIAVQ